MFNKSLFKQSCKANGIMWIIITVAVCFMLSCVMLIAGNGNLGNTKKAIENTIIKERLTSETEGRAINYYDISEAALKYFDEQFAQNYAQTYQTLLLSGKTEQEASALASKSAYAGALTSLKIYTAELRTKLGYAEGSDEALELEGIIFYTLNPLTENGTYMFDSFYASAGEIAPRYDIAGVAAANRAEYREKYAMTYSGIFLSANMVKDENAQKVIGALSDYGITDEIYSDFGFKDYQTVKDISAKAVVDYRAKLEYRIDNMKSDETVEGIKTEIAKDSSADMLSMLPTDVSEALKEIGQADLYGTLVGSIFFKMAGLLLPIIYMIMTANALIAGQVDSGSMAYILSSSVKRRTVAITQGVFLVGSLLLMFSLTTATSMICLKIADVDTGLTYGKLALINLGAFLVMFAMSGICFLASCIFNRSKYSMAIGGGLNMFFLVATMLGLFGSPVIPSIIRMSALNSFNYVSIISLFDVISILDGTNTFIYKLCILVAVGLVCYIVGTERFTRKDLPL